MAQDWNKCAVGWESNKATGEFAKKAFAELKMLTNLEGKRVVDFGCGTGLLSQKIAPLAKDIIALDCSEAMIEELDKKLLTNVEPVVDHLTRGLIAQHPAFRGQFDCIVASSVCGFLEDYQEAAHLVYSLLEDEGLFVHWDWLSETDDQGLTESRIEQVLLDAGFDTVTVSVPFYVETEQGKLSVVMGIGEK